MSAKKYSKEMCDSIVKLAEGVSYKKKVGKLEIPCDGENVEILIFEEIEDGEFDNEGYPYQVLRSYISEGIEEMSEIADNTILLMDYIDSNFSREQIKGIKYSLVDY